MKNYKIISTQYPSPFEDDLIQHWREDIKRIYDDWIFLYTDHVFFRNVAQGIAKAHDVKKPPPFDFYYMAFKYYLNSLCLAVRKSVDRDEKSVSLLVILSSMYIHNDLFTFEKGFESVSQKDSEFWQKEFKKTWDKFTDSNNSAFISKKVISRKIEKLFEITTPIKDFTNANIAHKSRKASLKAQQAEYKDLWSTANYIINLLASLKYPYKVNTKNSNNFPLFCIISKPGKSLSNFLHIFLMSSIFGLKFKVCTQVFLSLFNCLNVVIPFEGNRLKASTSEIFF